MQVHTRCGTCRASQADGPLPHPQEGGEDIRDIPDAHRRQPAKGAGQQQPHQLGRPGHCRLGDLHRQSTSLEMRSVIFLLIFKACPALQVPCLLSASRGALLSLWSDMQHILSSSGHDGRMALQKPAWDSLPHGGELIQFVQEGCHLCSCLRSTGEEELGLEEPRQEAEYRAACIPASTRAAQRNHRGLEFLMHGALALKADKKNLTHAPGEYHKL